MDFLSDGTIKFDISGTLGMMDLWAASHLMQVKGDEVYVSGMHMLREAMAAEEAKDPARKIHIATAPLRAD